MIGNNITLAAPLGAIGEKQNPLDINSSNFVDGILNASALNDIFIHETLGGIDLDLVDSATGNVRLVTVSGGDILEAGADAEADIIGNSIDLETISTGSMVTASINFVTVPSVTSNAR